MSGLRIYGLLLRAYPRAFRSEYGPEMMDTIRQLGTRREYSGPIGRALLALRTVPDLLRGAAVERIQEARASAESPSYGYALAAAAGVWLLYLVTLAPTTGFWDAGEYITAAHILGIPHPPGNPLFVLVAHFWESLLAPLHLSVAVRINLLSATASAIAHGFWFLVVERLLLVWTPSRTVRRVGALTAVLTSAAAFTVWNQSNVNEKVYTLSLLTVAAVSWLVLVWRDRRARGAGDGRWLVLIAFLIALTASNHLMGVLVAPAVVVMVLMTGAKSLLRPHVWVAAFALSALALSVHLFLPYRAAQDPILSEGDPRCERWTDAAVSVYTWGGSTVPGVGWTLPEGCPALSRALTRQQYGKPPVDQDPTVYPYEHLPRGPGLIWAQVVQYAQYFDWQWARSMKGHATVFGGARPLFTLLFLALGLLGAASHFRRDRAGAAYLGVLFLIYSLGLVWYLNFKYGYSLGWERFPSPDAHEVRERDYFFIISFSVWALWVGCGLTTLWLRLAAWLEQKRALVRGRPLRGLAAALGKRRRMAQWAASPVLAVALVPLALNWSWAGRADDWAARDFAYNMLMSVEPYGVLFTHGDNDTFPLWYLQEVEGIRRDVTVAVLSYLNTPWYVKQLRALSRPCPPGVDPSSDPTRIICQRPYRPEEMPPALLAAGVRASVPPPGDSAFPLSDQEIASIAAAGPWVTREPMRYAVGGMEATIQPGTVLEPADTFVAVVLQRTLGKRPIHFASPGPSLGRLGLEGYGVRVGLTIEVDDTLPASGNQAPELAGTEQTTAEPLGRFRIPDEYRAAVTAPYVDVTRTDTLLEDVFRRRGHLLDTDRPWADAATTNILAQYAQANLSLAAALDAVGAVEHAQRHLGCYAWWRDRGGAGSDSSRGCGAPNAQ